MRLAVRVLGPVLVLLALLFAWPATASASGSPTVGARHVCAYDVPIYDAPANYTATERGPPVARHDRDFAYFADDHRSNGASARPSDPTTRDTYDYDATSTLMQVDNSAGTPSEPAAATDLAFSPLQRWHVAAKTPAVGDDLLKPGPWARDSVPSSAPGKITQSERDALNPIGDAYGCHSCGATTPGTKSGNWIGDHQPP